MSRQLVEQAVDGTVAEIAYCHPGWDIWSPQETGVQILLKFPEDRYCCLSWKDGEYIIVHSCGKQEWLKTSLCGHNPVLALREAAVWATLLEIPEDILECRIELGTH